jgi:hypothetical protein
VTIDDRMVVDLTDVVGIQVECLGRKTAVNFPAEGWNHTRNNAPRRALQAGRLGGPSWRTLRTPRTEPSIASGFR